MRVLFVGACERDYLAKSHESFRTGIRRLFDVRMFGEGYPDHDPSLRSYPEIVERVFPDAEPDLLVAMPDHVAGERFPYRFPLDGIERVRVPKAIVWSDFWNATEHCPDAYLDWLERSDVSFVLCYYPHPGRIFAGSRLASRFVCLLPSFDPELFNDWGVPKEWDVGFLGGGVATPDPFYPERAEIHRRLLARRDLRYLWKPHPGWGNHAAAHTHVGAGFSRTIGACRIFVTTGGRYHCPFPKYVEALASGSALFATRPEGEELLRLRDGVNYVRITPDDVLDKIDWYLARPDRLASISAAGLETALRWHSCYARAVDFHAAVRPALAQAESGSARAEPLRASA